MLDPKDPEVYTIPMDSMLAMTEIQDFSGTIPDDEMDQYVSGVY